MSDEAAKALINHEGDLDFNNLKSFSDEAAISLSNHKGRLFLNTGILPKLKKKAADALRKKLKE